MTISRCAWVPPDDQLYLDYHDQEWGVPVHDDHTLFEFLLLEGFQAGLSWRTILYKRTNFKKAFDNFNPQIIANYSENKISQLLADKGIIRNKLKINAAVSNARAFIEVQEQCGSFDEYLWDFVNGSPIQNSWKSLEEIPARTEISDAMSKDLKQKGFKFVGSTICYAHMQAVGMVNDHTVDCFRYEHIRALHG